MTKQEIQEFDELYQYVKFKILEYDSQVRLPRYFVLRLKGLAKGKFMSNKKIKPMANYTFKEILYTFKFNSIQIRKAISKRTRFKDEQHLFNMVMVIIEKEINNVVERVRNVNRTKKKAEEANVMTRKKDVEYKKMDSKSESFKNKIKDLWWNTSSFIKSKALPHINFKVKENNPWLFLLCVVE